MNHYRNKYFLMILFTALILSACKKQWDQRDKVTNQQFDVTLAQQIKANANLSTFARILAKGGYDKILSSSKNFTVWAPDNASFQGVDTSFMALATHADSIAYKRFVGNHIANQSYLTTQIQTSLRVRALNGKNLTLTATTVEDATIATATANQYVGNGVLNIINKVLVPKMNIDEFITNLSQSDATMQKLYVRGQDSSYVDTTKATVASIDPKTGKPILVPNTGVVNLNKYYNKVGNLASEDSVYTYIILNDAAYTIEKNKVKPYFATSSADTTDRLAAYNVLKDVVIKGKIAPAGLTTGTLKSVMGKPVPAISSGAVVSSYEASNGMVYIVNSLNFAVKNKIDTIFLQGEQPSFYTRTDRAGNAGGATTPSTSFPTFIETAITGPAIGLTPGYVTHQLQIRTTGLSAFFAAYRLSNLNTCQYKVIYRAVNDTITTHIPAVNTNGPGVISEAIKFGPITGAKTGSDGTVTASYTVTFPYFNVIPYATSTPVLDANKHVQRDANNNIITVPVTPDPLSYKENEATGATSSGTNQTITAVGGRLNVVRINSVNMYVIGAAVTTNNLNNIIVDYIKLIPITN